MIEHGSQKHRHLLVFTDLDGTLLDHETYSLEPALPALNTLKEKNIPLIFCTSKTRAEIEMIKSQLHSIHPFISENGGAIFPFILEDETSEEIIQENASRSNLQITRGGRFYHLTGQNDKGKAVSVLRNIYREKFESLKTVALGDSLNDLPMLKVVDYAILVQKPDRSYDPSVKVDNLILASGNGPSGWRDALLKLLNKIL